MKWIVNGLLYCCRLIQNMCPPPLSSHLWTHTHIHVHTHVPAVHAELADAHRSLSVLSQCRTWQQSAAEWCLFYWMFISLCKTCHSGTFLQSDALKPVLALPLSPLSPSVSPSVNSVYIGSVSSTSLRGCVIHPVRHCKQHLYMFINTAQPL